MITAAPITVVLPGDTTDDELDRRHELGNQRIILDYSDPGDEQPETEDDDA